MNIYDPESSDSYMSESMSSSVWKYWQKGELSINTDFSVTGWMLCIIPPILKYESNNSDSDHKKEVNNVIK